MIAESIGYRGWVLEVDAAATAAAYSEIQSPTTTCECRWCANFVAWRQHGYPQEILVLMPRLGLDPNRESDVYQQDLDRNEGTVLYRWFFFFRGRVVSGPQAWTLTEDDPDPVLAVTKWELHMLYLAPRQYGFAVGFGDSPSRIRVEGTNVPPSLRKGPTTQLEFRAFVPWTVSETLPQHL